MIAIEKPAQEIVQIPAEVNQQEVVHTTCVTIKFAFPRFFDLSIPESFIRGLEDLEQGRFVDLDKALSEPPSA